MLSPHVCSVSPIREATNEKRRKCSIRLCPLVSMATQRQAQGSCILLHLASSVQLSLGRQSTGQLKSKGRKAEDQLRGRGAKEEKEGCSGREDAVRQVIKRPCAVVFVL